MVAARDFPFPQRSRRGQFLMASRGQFVVSPDKRVCAVQRHVPKVLLRLLEDELGGSNS